MKKLIVANWKMNLGVRDSYNLAAAYKKLIKKSKNQVVACPSFCAIADVAEVLKTSDLAWGAQDISWDLKGACTGEVSGVTLQELGCTYVIIGHSERRQRLGESCRMVNLKAKTALDLTLTPIICVGESEVKRSAGASETFVKGQVKRALAEIKLKPMQELVIAYEPIWAIGSGKTAKPRDIEAMHCLIRETAMKMLGTEAKLRVIYGGSVDDTSVEAIAMMPSVDGFLVGGASLKPEVFAKIAKVE